MSKIHNLYKSLKPKENNEKNEKIQNRAFLKEYKNLMYKRYASRDNKVAYSSSKFDYPERVKQAALRDGIRRYGDLKKREEIGFSLLNFERKNDSNGDLTDFNNNNNKNNNSVNKRFSSIFDDNFDDKITKEKIGVKKLVISDNNNNKDNNNNDKGNLTKSMQLKNLIEKKAPNSNSDLSDLPYQFSQSNFQEAIAKRSKNENFKVESGSFEGEDNEGDFVDLDGEGEIGVTGELGNLLFDVKSLVKRKNLVIRGLRNENFELRERIRQLEEVVRSVVPDFED